MSGAPPRSTLGAFVPLSVNRSISSSSVSVWGTGDSFDVCDSISTAAASTGGWQTQEDVAASSASEDDNAAAEATLVANCQACVHSMTLDMRSSLAARLQTCFSYKWEERAQKAAGVSKQFANFDFSSLLQVVQSEWRSAFNTVFPEHTKALAIRCRDFRNELAHQSTTLSIPTLWENLTALVGLARAMQLLSATRLERFLAPIPGGRASIPTISPSLRHAHGAGAGVSAPGPHQYSRPLSLTAASWGASHRPTTVPSTSVSEWPALRTTTREEHVRMPPHLQPYAAQPQPRTASAARISPPITPAPTPPVSLSPHASLRLNSTTTRTSFASADVPLSLAAIEARALAAVASAPAPSAWHVAAPSFSHFHSLAPPTHTFAHHISAHSLDETLSTPWPDTPSGSPLFRSRASTPNSNSNPQQGEADRLERAGDSHAIFFAWPDAAEAYTLAMAAAHRSPSLLLKRAEACMHMGEFELAQADAEEALHADPLNPAAHMAVGDALAARNQLGEALAAFQTGIGCCGVAGNDLLPRFTDCRVRLRTLASGTTSGPAPSALASVARSTTTSRRLDALTLKAAQMWEEGAAAMDASGERAVAERLARDLAAMRHAPAAALLRTWATSSPGGESVGLEPAACPPQLPLLTCTVESPEFQTALAMLDGGARGERDLSDMVAARAYLQAAKRCGVREAEDALTHLASLEAEWGRVEAHERKTASGGGGASGGGFVARMRRMLLASTLIPSMRSKCVMEALLVAGAAPLDHTLTWGEALSECTKRAFKEESEAARRYLQCLQFRSEAFEAAASGRHRDALHAFWCAMEVGEVECLPPPSPRQMAALGASAAAVLAIQPFHPEAMCAVCKLPEVVPEAKRGEVAQAALAAHPSRPDVQECCGVTLLQLKDWSDAIQCFDRVLELDATRGADAYWWRSRCWIGMADAEAVKRELTLYVNAAQPEARMLAEACYHLAKLLILPFHQSRCGCDASALPSHQDVAEVRHAHALFFEGEQAEALRLPVFATLQPSVRKSHDFLEGMFRRPHFQSIINGECDTDTDAHTHLLDNIDGYRETGVAGIDAGAASAEEDVYSFGVRLCNACEQVPENVAVMLLCSASCDVHSYCTPQCRDMHRREHQAVCKKGQ